MVGSWLVSAAFGAFLGTTPAPFTGTPSFTPGLLGAAANFDLLALVDDGVASESPADEDPCHAWLRPRSFELALEPWLDLPAPDVAWASHVDAQGEEIHYEQIAKRHDRPADYEAYQYPVERFLGWPRVLYGYDLNLPSELQRRGTMRAVGHGGVDLPQFMGAPIRMVPLVHQVGDAEVLYVGPLFGLTVVTRHSVREAGERRDYVLLFGHLSEAAHGLKRGQRLAAGATVGAVGDSDSPNLVHLHLEARRVRDGVDARHLFADGFVSQAVVTDPRNVLPLAQSDDGALHRAFARSNRCVDPTQGLYRIGLREFSAMRLSWQPTHPPRLR
jgi:hypothetical protein